MKKTLTLITLFSAILAFNAQTTKEEIYADINKTGGVYYAYPTVDTKPTKIPDGYEAFYISHYSRHGSRWLIQDQDFFGMLKVLRKANESQALTEVGKSALYRLEKIWIMAEGHNGDLTELGARQQKDISRRMAKNYPFVFEGESIITGKSTVVPRCILSMAYFANELKGLHPTANIKIESSDKYMKYLNHHTKESNDFRNAEEYWQEEKRKFKQESFVGDRFVKNLFSSDDYIYKNINPEKTIEAFYWIASDMQNIDTDVSFYDLFTKEELFNAYQYINYQTYVHDGPSPLSNGLVKANAIPLVKNILEEAQNYIQNNKKGASLRFGHDGNIIPLLAFLNIEGMNKEEINPREVYKIWNTFQAAPMAANLQMVFFKNKKNDVLVKFLLNEKEVSIPIKTPQFPYYSWKSVESYLSSLISK